MKLVDECIVELKAGNGGNGIIAWRREAHNPYGGPYGGDGGDGGNIIVIGDHNIDNLLHLKNHKRISAQNGENGGSKLANGKNGKDNIIHVPLGTIIFDQSTSNIIAEILKHGETKIICHGGKGGHGNGWFANSQNKIPNLYENGDIGELLKAKLVIKYISDVGLIGLPNAGKSTLISAITSSKPKIANYEFTTLNPVLGVCKYKNERMIISDIPGLISGASEGKGLGYEFLKHVERCSILVHLISLNVNDGEDIKKSYQTIETELKKYNSELLNKPILIVANKIDCENANLQLNILRNIIDSKDLIVISAKNKTNINELINKIYNIYTKIKTQQNKPKNKKQIKVIELKKQIDLKDEITITQIDEHTWDVKSKYLKYWSNRIPLKTNDNIIRFNQKIKNLDIENKIKKSGGVKGDTLLIYGNEMVID
ncbi:MAG: GTPase ObgE [Mycoplasma sp.]|nr:GTPase ObgE [Mycoplasma sp.]